MAYGRTFFREFILFGILSHSWMAHKEFRFIYPLMPALLLYIGHGMNIFISKASKLSRFHKYALIFGCIVVNIVIAVLINQWHCVGPIHTVNFMNHRIGALSPTERDNIRIFWLTPCHAAPYYAGIHFPVHMDFLHCEPPIEPFVSESHRFPSPTVTGYQREDISFFDNSSVCCINSLATSVDEAVRIRARGFKSSPVNEE